MSCMLMAKSDTEYLVHCLFYSTLEILKTLDLGSPVALCKSYKECVLQLFPQSLKVHHNDSEI